MINDPMFAAQVSAILIIPLVILIAALIALVFGGGVMVGWFL